jgi:TonB family protein
LNVVEPVYPQELMKQGISGNIIVDFYIDETGKARFPTAMAGTNETLAGIAVAAVQQWRFIPPTAKGKPVLVQARQVFTFEKDEKS